jgi:hypothetical protein
VRLTNTSKVQRNPCLVTKSSSHDTNSDSTDSQQCDLQKNTYVTQRHSSSVQIHLFMASSSSPMPTPDAKLQRSKVKVFHLSLNLNIINPEPTMQLLIPLGVLMGLMPTAFGAALRNPNANLDVFLGINASRLPSPLYPNQR